MIIAFVAVYLFWGATFLGMKLAIASIPPYVMAGVRFMLAGGAMYLWSRWRGNPPPTRAHWKSAATVGALLMLFGNGNVAWAQQRLPTGITAILVASAAIWIVLLDWWRPGGQRPSAMVLGGMGLGMVGIAILVSSRTPGARLDSIAVLVLLISAASWAAGSIVSRQAPAPKSWVQSTGMQMLCGGTFLFVAALLTGQFRHFSIHQVTTKSLLGFAYLVFGGSIIGFTAYMWLLSRVSAAKAATYAYVNPIVAMILGVAFLGERLTPRAMLASALSLGGVGLITLARSGTEQEPPEIA